MRRVRGTRDLLVDGVEVVTTLVEKTHREVADRWTERAALIQPAAPLARGVNALQMASATMTYATIRLVTRGVGLVARGASAPFLDEDAAGEATPLREDAMGTRSWWLDHAESAVNGLYGDYLAERGNELDLGMTLRRDGDVVALTREGLAEAYPQASSRVVVFVHGLTATEWSWAVSATDFWGDAAGCFGRRLERELGYTPLYVRYNTGRHVSESGRALSALIDELITSYPTPVEEVVLVGHSMGGLVCRSAVHQASRAEAGWVKPLRHVFCIGSPHLGAPLEKGVNLLSAVLRLIPAAGASVPAAVIDGRSAGIRDLRFGYTLEEEWRGEDPRAVLRDNRHDVPLVDDVGYYAIAATVTRDVDHPAGRLIGDLLVRPPSGAGLAPDPERHVAFHDRRVLPGMSHLHLANHPAVYRILEETLAGS